MQQLNFTKTKQEGVFSFTSVVRPDATTEHPLIGFRKAFYDDELHQYLTLATYLSKRLNKYILIKATPDFKQSIASPEACLSKWQYHYIANDFDGLGLDKGFQGTHASEKEQQIVTKVDDLQSLRHVPEDGFGDKVSHISLFCLTENRWDDLRAIMRQEKPPALKAFLQAGERFIDIRVSKTEGFFHSMLIKSIDDMENEVHAFQYVIAPDN